jgi:DNA-binding MarR family transcriptional regulator
VPDGVGGTTGEEQRLAHAEVLIYRYSIAISAVIDEVVGAGSSGNHEVQVLVALDEHPGLRPRDLMDLTGLSRAGVAALVSRLEAIGLVERTPGRRDRRTMLTSLTRTGRRRLNDLETALDRHFAETGPLVEEIVTLLGVDVDNVRRRNESDTALAVAGRMGAAGGAYLGEVTQEVGLLAPRSRIALAALLADGPRRPGQLADVLDLTSGGLTYLVDQLEADGLVERSYGLLPEDRRAVVIQLTGHGAALARRVVAILGRHARETGEALAAALQPALVV